jgi:hypothetical protein
MYPGVRIPNLADVGTRARAKTVVSTDPAANTECSITVPAGKTYKLVSASVLTTQGATQTPLTALQIADASGNIVGRFNSASAATTASVNSQNSWFPGATLTAGAGLTTNHGPIPHDVLLSPGWVITTSTAGIGANTNQGSLVLNVIELS